MKIKRVTISNVLIFLVIFALFGYLDKELNTPEMKRARYENVEPPDETEKVFVSTLVKEVKDGKVTLKEYDELSPVDIYKLERYLGRDIKFIYEENFLEYFNYAEGIIASYILANTDENWSRIDKGEFEKTLSNHSNYEIISSVYDKEYKKTPRARFVRLRRSFWLLNFITILCLFKNLFYEPKLLGLICLNYFLYFVLTKLPTPLYGKTYNLSLTFLILLFLFYKEKKEKTLDK